MHFSKKIILSILAVAAFSGSYLSAAISATERDELIKKYAPLVKLDTEEKYYPSSVQFAIEKSDLKKNDQIIKKQGTFSISELGQYGQEYYLTGGVHEGMPKKGDYYDSPVYANFVETPGGAVIQYLFFYPYNGAFQAGEVLKGVPLLGDIASKVTEALDIGVHIGDWEHIDVHLARTPGGYALRDIYFARHSPENDGGFEAPGKYELAYGTHPIVYASKYGHASHPHHADYHKNRDKTSGNGPEWRTWSQPVYVGTKEQPTPGNEWLKFGGRWGASDHSPRNPVYQAWWRNSGFQQYPDESQKPLADIRVSTKSGGGRESELFSVGSVPTYIRKLVWNISDASGAAYSGPASPQQQITFTVFDEKNNKLFDITKDKEVTPYYGRKMYIGASAFDGRAWDATFYTVKVRGLHEAVL